LLCQLAKIATPPKESLLQVYEIEKLSFEDPYPAWYIRALHSLADNLFIAAYNVRGEIIGYAVAVPKRDRVCHIASIAVHPQCRRRGIGRALLESLEELCAAQGYSVCILEVDYTNWPALNLYQSSGYRWFMLIPNYYGSGKHAIAMVKLCRPQVLVTG